MFAESDKKMSYRIYLGIRKKKYLNQYIARHDRTEEYSYFDFDCRDIELHDGLDIERFSPITEYKDEEYEPYVLTKKDVLYIIEYYQKLNLENYKEKMKITEKEFNLDKRNSLGVHLMYMHIVTYFGRLIKEKTLITDAGFFLLDYFYLVKMYEDMKDDECGIITHG